MLLPSIVLTAAVNTAAAVAIAHQTDSPPFPLPLCKGVDIEDATIETLQQFMTQGKLTSRDLVTCYLARIEQTNSYTHSISEVNPDVLALADASDAERAANGSRGPMHGIPFLVKDNIYTDDKHNTSEGTLVLLGGRYSSEATVVAKMREAGGVLLGHSTMSEAADHRAKTDYASGYSSRTGQTRNPFNLTQSTAGSSSGSAVAVSINQAAIALGTETHGSLVHPSAQLGLYTVKSTPGLMSRHGIVMGSYYHDTPGPMARSMRDVAILLDILTDPAHGPDSYDNLTLTAVGKFAADGYLSKVVDRKAFEGMKLGLPWNPYWSTNAVSLNVTVAVERGRLAIGDPFANEIGDSSTIAELEAAGAIVVNISTKAFSEIASPYGGGHPSSIPVEFDHAIAFDTLLEAGYREWLQDWTFPEDDERYGMSTLAEMSAWNDAHNETTGSLGNGTWWWDEVSGQSFYDAAVATNGSLGSAFWTAFGWGRTTASQAIDTAYTYTLPNGTVVELDGVLVPNGRTGGYGNGCASIPSYAGHPVAAVPTGLDGYGVPFGMCVYGKKWGEAQLVHVASAMEDPFRWAETPQWYDHDTALDRPWDPTWPGYTCSESSLDGLRCDSP